MVEDGVSPDESAVKITGTPEPPLVDGIELIVHACLNNAEHLLNAARDVRKPGVNHIAYHLATMALEEVGKASMVAMSSLRPLEPGTAPEADEAEKRRPVDWIEDHERKLFWALWLPTFSTHKMTVAQFRESQDLAKRIHQIRLETLYVDPERFGQTEQVSDHDVDTLVKMANARLNLERAKDFKRPDKSSEETLVWFFKAVDDPQLKLLVMGESSMAKLSEFEGDAKKWFKWLRDVIGEMEQKNRQLAEEALQAKAPHADQENEPKWQIKVRLKTWSHSIRAKPLAAWNKKEGWIKLFPTNDKKELLIQFTLPKKCLTQAVWPAGMHYSWLFVISLNVSTLGYFWWYEPVFVSKFYEEIIDLENNASVSLERNPPLVVPLNKRALTDSDLSNVMLVLAHLISANQDQKQAYDRYFRALGLLAKNDIFGQFEHILLAEFYEAFRLGIAAYGDSSASLDLASAAERVFSQTQVGAEFVLEMKRILELASNPSPNSELKETITLDHVAKMKTFCDVYFLLQAKKEVRKKRKEESQQHSQSDV